MADKSQVPTDKNVEMNSSQDTDPSPIEVEQTERKITQTDHLNKKLLSAFLDHINKSGVENPDQALEEESNGEWENDQHVLFMAKMAKQVGKVLVIGISGTTNSGKSTLTRKLLEKLPNAVSVCQDSYFLPPGDERLAPLYIKELDHHNWEDYRALEMETMVADVSNIVDNAGNANMGDHVVIVEGFTIFGWQPLSTMCHLKYFLPIEQELCWQRRRSRTNYNPPDKPGYFEKVVWPMHLKHLEQVKVDKEIVYLEDTSLDNRLSRILDDINRHLCS